MINWREGRVFWGSLGSLNKECYVKGKEQGQREGSGTWHRRQMVSLNEG